MAEMVYKLITSAGASHERKLNIPKSVGSSHSILYIEDMAEGM
jgi:hypothetical protein